MSYLEFVVVPSPTKTEVVEVIAARDGSLLGRIKWFGRWRQFTFWPEPETTFNPDCLREIEQEIIATNLRRRAT